MRRGIAALTLTAVVAGVTVAVLAVAVSASGPAAWERSATRWVYDLPPPSTGFLRAVMQAGTRGAILVVAAGFAVQRRWRPAVAALAAGWGAWAAIEVTKLVVDRMRPDPTLLGRAPRVLVDGPGFPSSHAGIASALATVVVLFVTRPAVVRWLAVTVAILVAVARVHVAVHYPLDVIGGAATGVCAGALAALACGRPAGPVASTGPAPETSASRPEDG